jgi:hypothetical protein
VAAGAERVRLQFVLANHGPVPVWFHDGGRGRNQLGRDNRFTFVVERDGVPVPTTRVEDFGGIGIDRRLEPGAEHAFAVDLAHWCRLPAPGRYLVRATYEAELVPGEFVPHHAGLPELAHGHRAHFVRTRMVEAECVVTAR